MDRERFITYLAIVTSSTQSQGLVNTLLTYLNDNGHAEVVTPLVGALTRSGLLQAGALNAKVLAAASLNKGSGHTAHTK